MKIPQHAITVKLWPLDTHRHMPIVTVQRLESSAKHERVRSREHGFDSQLKHRQPSPVETRVSQKTNQEKPDARPRDGAFGSGPFSPRSSSRARHAAAGGPPRSLNVPLSARLISAITSSTENNHPNPPWLGPFTRAALRIVSNDLPERPLTSTNRTLGKVSEGST